MQALHYHDDCYPRYSVYKLPPWLEWPPSPTLSQDSSFVYLASCPLCIMLTGMVSSIDMEQFVGMFQCMLDIIPAIHVDWEHAFEVLEGLSNPQNGEAGFCVIALILTLYDRLRPLFRLSSGVCAGFKRESF